MEKYIDQNYQEGKVMLVFSADWCPDCLAIKPFMPEIISMYPEIKFFEVDNDDNQDLCDVFDIFGIPAFIFLNDGEVVAKYVDKHKKAKEQVIEFINSNQ